MLAYQLEYNKNVITEGLSCNREAAVYLDNEFKNCVTKSIEDLLRERPTNPVCYLAEKIKWHKKQAEPTPVLEEKTQESVGKSKRRSSKRDGSLHGEVKSPVDYFLPEISNNLLESEKGTPKSLDSYILTFSGGIKAPVHTLTQKTSRQIRGVNAIQLINPSLYDLDSAIRLTEASSIEDKRTGKTTPVVLVVEQAKAPEQVVFVKGIPYRVNLSEPLQQAKRQGLNDVPRPSENETYNQLIISLLKEQLCDDVFFIDKIMSDYVRSKNDEGSDIRLALLPAAQVNYLETYDCIDNVFSEIMHPDLVSCIQEGKYFKQLPSTQNTFYAEPPSVIVVSYNPMNANLTLSRVLQSFFPYYEKTERLKMDELRSLGMETKAKYSLKYCLEYWADVHRRREERDKLHKNNSAKSARFLRREREDDRFLKIVAHHKNSSAIKIQRVFRGYLVRKKYSNGPSQASAQTVWAKNLQLSVPPLLRLCIQRLSKIHGEIFGNYDSSLLPEPQKVVVYKPKRTVVSGSDEDSEEEEWVEEVLLIPPKRFSQQPSHFNPLQRLLEYNRVANCNLLETAIKIQRQCSGMSLLQRRAYEYLKSLVLDLLHIAFLELFHRDRLGTEVMQFSSFVNTYHGAVCGWLSSPHLVSQCSLLALFKPSVPLRPNFNSLLTTERLLEISFRAERLLLLGSWVEYLSPTMDFSQICAHVGVKKIAEKVFSIPKLVSSVEWNKIVSLIAEKSTEGPEGQTPKICWWFISEAPCVYIYGKVLTCRSRRNYEVVEGRRNYDEFCPREITSAENSDKTSSTELRKSRQQSPTQLSRTMGEMQSVPQYEINGSHNEAVSYLSSDTEDHPTFSRFFSDYSIYHLEDYLKTLVLHDLIEFGKIEYYAESLLPHVFKKKTFDKAEMDAEKLQQMNSHFRDLGEIEQSRTASRTDTYQSSKAPSTFSDKVEKTETDEVGSMSNSILSASNKMFSMDDWSNILSVREQAIEVCKEQNDLDMELIRPLVQFSAQEDFINRFASIVECAIKQMKEGSIIVVNHDQKYQFFYCIVMSVIQKECETADRKDIPDTSSSTEAHFQLISDRSGGAKPEKYGGTFTFLEDLYAIIDETMSPNGINVTICIAATDNAVKLTDYPLLDLIATEIRNAEQEPETSKCQKHILQCVRYIEQYVWILLLHVYLSLPFTKNALAKEAINHVPSFQSFFKSVGAKKWIESIDPWARRPHECPDTFHTRYTNALRRWDADDYICFGSIVDQDLE